MRTLTRREFAQLSTAAALSAGYGEAQPAGQTPVASKHAGGLEVKGGTYSWQYTEADDIFHLFDSERRLMVSGRVQPAIVVTRANAPSTSTPGHLKNSRLEPGNVTLEYEGVNGHSNLTLTWRFSSQPSLD